MWLRHEGLEDPVRKHISEAKRDFDFELANLYVSDAMAKAILAARPDFAGKPAEVKLLLEKQFPRRPTSPSRRWSLRPGQALMRNGKMPCTLIVLDEVQQYIGERRGAGLRDRLLQRQFTSQLGAPGHSSSPRAQDALTGNAASPEAPRRLSRHRRIADTDVEQVTREWFSRRSRPPKGRSRRCWRITAGKLNGNCRARRSPSPHARPFSLLVQDYPILPVRRRFWERVLARLDKAGTGAQLRTQLWIVFDAMQKTADCHSVHVVGGAFLFEHIKSARCFSRAFWLQEKSPKRLPGQKKEDDGEHSLPAFVPDLPDRPTAATRGSLLTPAFGPTPRRWPTCSSTISTPPVPACGKQVPELLAKLVASGAIMPV